jgi:hypothetical protein
MGRPFYLGTHAALWREGTAGAVERDGSRGECESDEGERGIGFFLRSRSQGDKVVQGGARGGGGYTGCAWRPGGAGGMGRSGRVGMKAERRSRLLSGQAHERQVASGRVGPGPIPTELSSMLLKWAGRSQRASPFDLFLLLTSFLINSKVPVSKIQILILLNSNTFQIWQVGR